MTQPTVFISAATGTQSSSLIRALSSWSSSTSTPITIHGTTRNASSSVAQGLVAANTHAHCAVKLFNADFNDPSSLATAATGATHAFLNVTPVLTDMTLESKHANNILDALRSVAANTLQRIVYTSVHGLLDPSVPGNYHNLDSVPWMKNYFISKYGIEVSVIQFARELSIPHTLLHPGTFLTNLLPPASTFMYAGLATPGQHTITTALHPTHVSSWLDPECIGEYALRALLSVPRESDEFRRLYDGQVVPIAAFPLTLSQVVDSLNEYLAQRSSNDNDNDNNNTKIPKGTKVQIAYIAAEDAERQKQQNPLVASQLFQNDNQALFEPDAERGGDVYGVDVGSVQGFWEREGKAGRVAEALGYA